MRSYAAAEDYPPVERHDTLPLFSQPEVRTLARRTDPPTSQAAAVAIADKLTELQARVYAAFREHGSMTGKEAENLPEFKALAPSTVRHRITDLHRGGWLTATEQERENCTVYEMMERSEAG